MLLLIRTNTFVDIVCYIVCYIVIFRFARVRKSELIPFLVLQLEAKLFSIVFFFEGFSPARSVFWWQNYLKVHF